MKYEDFFIESGRINSGKVKEKWVKTHKPTFFKEVSDYIESNSIIAERFVEKLWYFFNDKKVLFVAREKTAQT